MRKRLKFLFVAPLAALAVLALSGPAAAQTPGTFFSDPQDTNVPYVGWVGDKIRLVKCEAGNVAGTGNWALVDWSGALPDRSETIRPSFLQTANGRPGFAGLDRPNFPGLGDQIGRTCFEMIVTSMKPGLAQIKLETTPTAGGRSVTHDFNVIFLEMSTITLDELGNGEIPGLVVGDPLGDGNFNPISGAFLNGYFQVDVTGSFPLGRNFAGDLDAGDQDVDTVVLPRDWELLARTYGVSKRNAVDPRGWDIHDDQTNREGHVATSGCGLPDGLREAVDNCFGGSENGRFSRIGPPTFQTVGPFDPLRPSSSYLPDGVVDAGDAPMPALRINLALSGGFGALLAADKTAIYSRNGLGSVDNPATPAIEFAHNLYAPFYTAFIPATRAEAFFGTSSGTTGDLANNFPGYQSTAPFANVPAGGGLYQYWDLINPGNRSVTTNNCFDVGGTGQFGRPGERIQTPTGIQSALVYTDEHGEAIVQFNPNTGVTLAPDNQGLCDLGEIGTARQIATATINASAELPFQQAQRPISATALTKRLFSLAGKSLDCVAKTPIEAFCVETVRDIRGNPVSGALVAFSREPLGKIEGAELPATPVSTDPAATFQGFDTRGSDCSDRTLSVLPGAANEILCRTNAKGQAGIVVKSTLPGLVDIDAENVGTRNGGFGVQRVRCIRFAGDGVTLPADANFCSGVPVGSVGTTTTVSTAATTAATTTAATPTTGGSSPTGTTPAAAIVSLAGNPIPAAAPKAPAAKTAASVRSAKLVVIRGKRYLVVRASGSAATAKVRITLVMRTGKVTKPVLRTIRTNRAVRVPNLLISKHVRTVRVSVVS